MEELFYLKNTLSNLESWFDGFVTVMLDSCDDDTPDILHQMIVLYERQITEIIEHAKNLVKDIEEGEMNET